MRFIRTRQVLEMIGVGRTTLWKMVQAGSFPRPVRITERNSGYLLDTVEQWMRLRAQGLPWQPEVGIRTVGRSRTRQRKLALARPLDVLQGSGR